MGDDFEETQSDKIRDLKYLGLRHKNKGFIPLHPRGVPMLRRMGFGFGFSMFFSRNRCELALA